MLCANSCIFMQLSIIWKLLLNSCLLQYSKGLVADLWGALRCDPAQTKGQFSMVPSPKNPQKKIDCISPANVLSNSCPRRWFAISLDFSGVKDDPGSPCSRVGICQVSLSIPPRVGCQEGCRLECVLLGCTMSWGVFPGFLVDFPSKAQLFCLCWRAGQ